MPTSNDNKDVYSRSSLAKDLGVSLKELTQVMIDSGWLRHVDTAESEERWVLTAKGEFEGGVYKDSSKFGRYIAWPSTVLNHPAIVELSRSQLSASAVAKHYNVSAKTINRLFADIGWIVASDKGWLATPAGQQQGACQTTSDTTGIPYVVWQRNILEHPMLNRHVGIYTANEQYLITVNLSHQKTVVSQNKTVLATSHRAYQTLNGLVVTNKADLLLANYLHIYGIRFTYQRVIEGPSKQKDGQGAIFVPDFFLSDSSVCLVIERSHIPPEALAEQIGCESGLKQLEYRILALNESDIEAIETVLPKRLLPLGVSLY